jgi:invasion protein IalB
MTRKVTLALSMLAAVCCADLPLSVAAQQPQQKQAKPAAVAPKPAAQSPGAAPPQPAAGEANAPAPLTWTTRCFSEGRKAALLCEVEQSMFITKTGQLVASVNVKLPADTRQPVMMIQLPVGLFLPAGVSLQIDEGKPQSLAIQTCDLKGCYAATPVAPEMLGAMKSGKRLAVVFQNLNKENVNLAFALSGFVEGYDKIN